MLPIQKVLFALNIILLFAALTALILNIYAYTKRYLFMESEPLMTRTFITLMVLSITVGTASLFGVLTRKMKRSISVVNIVWAGIFAVAFIGIGVAAAFVPKIALGNENCQNSDIKWIASGKKANSWGFLFCLSPLCYCDMNNYKGFNQEDIKSLDIIRPNRNAHNNVHHIQQCSPYIVAMMNDNYTLALSNHFGMIEQELKCSGWCEYSNFSYIYIFSDVNNGKPGERACFPALKDYVYKVVNVGRGFSFFIGFLLLCISCVNIFIICKIKRNSQTHQYSLYEDDSSFAS